ncbi:hypothetical protein [Actinotalea sp. Marseille-Q4924]|uniref:hypothetical protein n=1 Tax=Actinotalea sp. Marseille-Q4924 TaxID=2866571 RepID=UPI001CE4AF06|nr:hypothetical protein [Actinotalea sp. Marseille-Q4924]
MAEPPLPNAEETVTLLDDLIAEWKAVDGPIDVRVDGHISHAVHVFGLVCHTYALADAVLHLRAAGHHVQSVPLIRQAMEGSAARVGDSRSQAASAT